MAGLPTQASRNPFRSNAHPPSASEPPSHTDLDISPSALERAPSPEGEPSRSPSPEAAAPSTGVQPSNPGPTSRSPAPPPPQQYAPPPGPPPGHHAPPALEAAITEELPPAYTPIADIRQGETTIEFGPRRPFGNTTRGRGSTPPQRGNQRVASGRGWQAYPGRGSAPPGRMPTAPLIQVSPPPQHPALPPRSAGPRSAPALPPPQLPLSDFARDFYTARGGQRAPDANISLMGGSSAQYEGDGEGAQIPPSIPPRPTENGNLAGSGSRSQEEIPDDGRPTQKPVPGHPLLNSGKVLMYPAGYECNKCACHFVVILCGLAQWCTQIRRSQYRLQTLRPIQPMFEMLVEVCKGVRRPSDVRALDSCERRDRDRKQYERRTQPAATIACLCIPLSINDASTLALHDRPWSTAHSPRPRPGLLYQSPV